MIGYIMNYMRILIVEDDKDVRDFLKVSLASECFAVDVAEDGDAGFAMASSNDYDLIILDNILPNKLGCEVCSDLRKEGKGTPVLILSIRGAVEDKVQLLDSGADDYLSKPFSLDELLARVRAILRRPAAYQDEKLCLDNLSLDIPAQKVFRGENRVYLTRKEFALLEYLLKNRGKVMSRGNLIEHVWDMNADPMSNTVESHILNLRKKIDIGENRKLIHTVPGRGYKIDLEK